MSWQTVCVCDECGAIKGHANQWILWSDAAITGAVCFMPWNAAAATSYGHLCSEACALRKFTAIVRREQSAVASEIPAHGMLAGKKTVDA